MFFTILSEIKVIIMAIKSVYRPYYKTGQSLTRSITKWGCRVETGSKTVMELSITMYRKYMIVF